MTADGRTFAVASDDALVALINTARHRLVVIAPALSTRTAEAIARRFDDLGTLDVRVILDADPEVYRLGFGDSKALEIIREAAAQNFFDLREQSGVRIGVVISDDDTMIFAPVSKNIEAGSSTVDQPNAIMLKGAATTRLAAGAGAACGDAPLEPEIGQQALKPEKVAAMMDDLNRNPVAQYDITRRLNVFSSRVVFIEFSIKNSSLSRKQVKLPPEFGVVSNKDLADRISSRIQAPFESIGDVEVTIGDGAEAKTVKIDEKWLRTERKRIEDAYTFQIDNFGRVMLHEDRDGFEKATDSFRVVVERYQTQVKQSLIEKRTKFEDAFVAEFLTRWSDRPPDYMTRWGRTANPQSLEAELRHRAGQVFDDMVDFDPPAVRRVEKNISPRNVADPAFLEPLREIMEKRRVPKAVIETLFSTVGAAPEKRGLS